MKRDYFRIVWLFVQRFGYERRKVPYRDYSVCEEG